MLTVLGIVLMKVLAREWSAGTVRQLTCIGIGVSCLLLLVYYGRASIFIGMR